MDFTSKDLMNQVCATVDWFSARKIEKCTLKMFLYSSSFHFFLVFMKSLPLYSLPSFDPSLPLVDYVDYPLDACPIRALLETLCVAVRLNTTIQVSFSHKCGQLVKCRTFNVGVAVFFSDIS